MDHQRQLEKSNYRNWVKGGLVYKYLKDGIEGFVDEIVVQEHKRILQNVKLPAGFTCNECTLKHLKPLHKGQTDPHTGKIACPRGQVNCNCLSKNKQPCQNKVCDAIFEEILEAHGSTPPTPNWKNTDIQKWCSTPWEVAKCFINAPGYADKTTASDIDAPGLLHVFINSINHQANLACKITGTDVLNRVLRRRNKIFHSPTMELDDKDLNELIDDVIEILEDEKELKANHDAVKAVEKLRQLKKDAFIITTHDEDEVCRAAMASIEKKSEELKQVVEDCISCIKSKETQVKQTADNANVDINTKRSHALKSIHDKTEDAKKEIDKKKTLTSKSIDDKLEEAKKEINTAIIDKTKEANKNIDIKQMQVLKSIHDETEDAKKEIDKKKTLTSKSIDDKLEEAKKEINTTIIDKTKEANKNIDIKQMQVLKSIHDETEEAKKEFDEKQAQTSNYIIDKTKEANKNIDIKQMQVLKSIHDETEEAKKEFDEKQAQTSNYIIDQLEGAKRDIDIKQMQVLKSIHDETEEAKKGLNKQNGSHYRALEWTIDPLKKRVIDLEQRLTEVEPKYSVNRIDVARTAQQKQLEYVNQKRACQRKFLNLYQDHYVKTGISPLKKQDNDININEVYVRPSMTVEEKEMKSIKTEGSSRFKKDNELERYRDIFQTGGSLHKKIYIVGDVGTGKTSLSKMMIYNWCKVIKSEDETTVTPPNDKAPQSSYEFDDTNEMRRFNFVFFIPLQRMSGHSSGLVEMIRLYYKDIVTSELLDRILSEESEHCLIIADGLDEWDPSIIDFRPEHVSYGLPLTDGLQNATVITLSRPSTKGILNMKSSEYDKKIMLHGIDSLHTNEFIRKYISKQSRNQNFFYSFIGMSNREHLEKTPLLLQQLVWMYCMGHGIGKTVGEIYSNVVNVMFSWSKSKDNLGHVVEDETRNPNEFQEIQLPLILKRLPRCEANKRYILQLGKIAFNALTAEISTSAFGLSNLLNSGLTKKEITTLTSFGILVEYNCIDPTYEDVYFSFIHRSYFEFFAGIYISSQNSNTIVLEGLFKKYKRPADILQLSNLLKMVCGLSPVLLGEMSKLIAVNVANDESMLRYRKNLHDDKFLSRFIDSEQLQDLIYGCLCECGTGDQPIASLCDIVISNGYDMSFFRQIIPSSVLSLLLFPPLYCNSYPSVSRCYENQDILKWAAQLPMLQYLSINGPSDRLQCNLVQELASIIQKAVSLKHLSLVHMVCFDQDCKGHVIDLSKHNQLHSIHIEGCSYGVVSLGKSDHLKHIYISDYYTCTTSARNVVLDQLVSSLTKVISLEDLTLKRIQCPSTDGSGQTLDLSAHVQLHSIHIEGCSFGVVSLGKSEQLKHIYISDYTCTTSAKHVVLDQLVSSLTEVVSLKDLTLIRIKRSSTDGGGITLDFPAHFQLNSLHLQDCHFQVCSLGNTEFLENIYISSNLMFAAEHDSLAQLSLSLSKAVFLKHLTLKGIKCSSLDCGSHTIDLSTHVQLQNIYLENCPFWVGSLGNTEYLENVYISSNLMFSGYRIDLFDMQRLCLKLPNRMDGNLASSLTQAVALKHLTLQNIDCFHKTDYIDLSHHDQLQSIEIRNIPRCLSLTNSRTVKTMRVPIEIFALPRSLDCNANIQYLEIDGNYSNTYDSLYTISMNSRVQSLQQLQLLRLNLVNIDENVLVVSPAMQNLMNIDFFYVDMSLETWRTFLDSLCTLKQSVQVELKLKGHDKNVAAQEYVKRNTDMFEVVRDTVIFIFKTTAK